MVTTNSYFIQSSKRNCWYQINTDELNLVDEGLIWTQLSMNMGFKTNIKP